MHPTPAHTTSPLSVHATAAASCGDGGRWRTWVGASLLLASLAAADAWGFALGNAHVLSAIGEPLRVVVDLPALSKEEAETLELSIAPPDAFQAARLEYKPLLSDLKLEIERGRDGSARLKLQGNHAVSEAYVDLLLQANWKGGQVTRDYTLLLGPTGAAMSSESPLSMETAAAPASRRVASAPLPPLRPKSSAEKPATPDARPQTARKPAPEPAALPAAAVAAAPVRAHAPEQATTAAPTTAAAPTPSAGTAPVTATTTTPPPAAEAPASQAPASPTVPAAAPTPARAPVPAATAQPAVAEDEWLTQSKLLAATALLLAGLAGLLVWRRKRQQAQDDALPEPAGIAVAAGAGLSAETSKAQGPISSMVYSPSQLEASGEIDPVAEADVYLAYGRVQQAEEILRDALLVHPDQASLHLKLLEIAVQRQDRSACAALMDKLSDLTRRQGPDWNEASELAGRLPPDQPETGAASLMGTATASGIAPVAMTPAQAPLAPTVPEPNEAVTRKDLPPLDLSLSAAEPETAVAAAVPDIEFEPEPEPAAASLDQGLEFSLDFEQLGSDRPPEPPAAIAPESASAAGQELALDFELVPENKADELTDLVVSEDNSVSDPLATQLELAQEFLDLGDADGARSLVERVLARATGDLQARARALLDQLEAGRPQ